MLWTGHPATCTQLAATSQSCSEASGCPGGGECVITGITGGAPTGFWVDHAHADLRRGRVVLSDETWGVTAGFVSRHASGTLPSPMVYLGACRTMFVGNFAAEYLALGAAAVAGWGEYVTSDFAQEAAAAFFDALIVQRQSSGAALFAAEGEDPDSPGGRLRMLGTAQLDLMAEGLLNPSFEEGTPHGWQVDGDGRVIGKLASIGAPEGKYMGIVSTGLGFTVTTGQLSQAMCIPDHSSTLRFRWRLCSEEFEEWCGSVFRDASEATLVADTGQLSLVNVQIDDLCHYDDGACAPCPDPTLGCDCGSQYVGLTSDTGVVCDQGGVWCTPWQELEADVTPLAGAGPVELRLFTTNTGDSIFDTAVLLDGFELE